MLNLLRIVVPRLAITLDSEFQHRESKVHNIRLPAVWVLNFILEVIRGIQVQHTNNIVKHLTNFLLNTCKSHLTVLHRLLLIRQGFCFASLENLHGLSTSHGTASTTRGTTHSAAAHVSAAAHGSPHAAAHVTTQSRSSSTATR